MFEKATDRKDIGDLALSLGIRDEEIDFFGRYMGKIDYHILERLQDKPDGKYIDVTAVTPTPFGEGKTVTTIGLGMALNKLGFKTVNALREPSMGPVFGIKGGGTGGGKSSLFPMEQINLHFTGDIHAVETATNLLAAVVDNHISQGNELDIDPQSISWRRTMDVEDRSMRKLTIQLTEKKDGVKTETSYETGFDIAAASPIMAIMGLTTGFEDLHQRLVGDCRCAQPQWSGSDGQGPACDRGPDSRSQGRHLSQPGSDGRGHTFLRSHRTICQHRVWQQLGTVRPNGAEAW